jgi:hypothetical protein
MNVTEFKTQIEILQKYAALRVGLLEDINTLDSDTKEEAWNMIYYTLKGVIEIMEDNEL